MLTIEKKDEHILVLTNMGAEAATFLANINGHATHFTIAPSTVSEVIIDVMKLSWYDKIQTFLLLLIPPELQLRLTDALFGWFFRHVISNIPISMVRTRLILKPDL